MGFRRSCAGGRKAKTDLSVLNRVRIDYHTQHASVLGDINMIRFAQTTGSGRPRGPRPNKRTSREAFRSVTRIPPISFSCVYPAVNTKKKRVLHVCLRRPLERGVAAQRRRRRTKGSCCWASATRPASRGSLSPCSRLVAWSRLRRWETRLPSVSARPWPPVRLREQIKGNGWGVNWFCLSAEDTKKNEENRMGCRNAWECCKCGRTSITFSEIPVRPKNTRTLGTVHCVRKPLCSDSGRLPDLCSAVKAPLFVH